MKNNNYTRYTLVGIIVALIFGVYSLSKRDKEAKKSAEEVQNKADDAIKELVEELAKK